MHTRNVLYNYYFLYFISYYFAIKKRRFVRRCCCCCLFVFGSTCKSPKYTRELLGRSCFGNYLERKTSSPSHLLHLNLHSIHNSFCTHLLFLRLFLWWLLLVADCCWFRNQFGKFWRNVLRHSPWKFTETFTPSYKQKLQSNFPEKNERLFRATLCNSTATCLSLYFHTKHTLKKKQHKKNRKNQRREKIKINALKIILLFISLFM